MLGLQPVAAQKRSEIKIAVAANFTEPARELAALFEKRTANKVLLSFGSTGQFYAQITQGAPFEVLVSADRSTPAKAIAEGYAVAGTAHTYAIGKLVLYSRSLDLAPGAAVLEAAKFAKIAIANPATAPYGAAAIEAMKALGVYDRLQPKIVQGNSIAQAFQFVETGNAEVGFVALSQVISAAGGSRWMVPSQLYRPIAQDAVLLTAGVGNDTAKAFLSFLRTPDARAIIEKYGYATSE